ncbi:MAG: hypothetical protein A2381_00830 [Bdellovibrionales bacterium RIFOXYB1_FULL_37_110]|nr:MAG: hypothetical protein A2417_01685 [Bdellovibrionales bacterium RIFOXYC1_FULL_37_79]OFZ58764.1 MAG: hypothetical protein A2381_00830 [Bdellovibrionales bacterium RIFOXYB1_FULL_37_110]OFZ64763.1 MAG: hypothetical protein A2577_06830 [Bdellovibrionales bacterium RIFOXYD1_FULL_36_51]
MWNIKQTEEFQDWFEEANNLLQADVVENVEVLRQMGPHLGRPKADTIKGSTISNLKELRFMSGEKVIRLFYVFDPDRNGVLLVGGNKTGIGNKKFYQQMIDKCEKIYVNYLVKRSKAIKKKTSCKTGKGETK